MCRMVIPDACFTRVQYLARGSRRDRVAAKFVENEFEKVDRLMELYERYEGRVLAEERRLGTSGEEYSDQEVLLARMDAGLYTLQQVPCLASLPIRYKSSGYARTCQVQL